MSQTMETSVALRMRQIKDFYDCDDADTCKMTTLCSILFTNQTIID